MSMISLARFSVGPSGRREARLGKVPARSDDRATTTPHRIGSRGETCAIVNGVTVHDRLLSLIANAGHESAAKRELVSLSL